MPEHSETKRPRGPRGLVVPAALTAAVLLTMALSLSRGRQEIPLETVARLVWLKIVSAEIPPDLRQAETILFFIRLPRIALSFLVGASLSVSGAAFQALFRNPLVAPDILGVSGGAGVGATLAIMLGCGSALLHLAAFSCGLGAVALILAAARLLDKNSSLLVLLLTGMVVSSLFSALGSLLKYLSSDELVLTSMVLWLMGSFAHAGSWPNVGLASLAAVLGVVPLLLARWSVDALAFGEEDARALGVDHRRLRLLLVVCATLLTASSVALCGLVGWVGLIVPHLARLLVGPNFGRLLPAAALGGGWFMLLADFLIRVVLPGEMPVGVVTALVGAPIFVYVLGAGRNKWS
ncbi:MAG: iron ABC transporter permease [Deltaproteobacteria bacterium]|nr:iron ABC transporter permease [Deltaproteobacteria bacterium]